MDAFVRLKCGCRYKCQGIREEMAEELLQEGVENELVSTCKGCVFLRLDEVLIYNFQPIFLGE
jgi:hypothetical protein